MGAGDSNAGQTTQNGGLINEGEREVSEVTVMPNPASDKASFNFKPINYVSFTQSTQGGKVSYSKVKI